MQQYIRCHSPCVTDRALALSVTLALHVALIIGLSQPKPAIILPLQQVMHVRMVSAPAPSVPSVVQPVKAPSRPATAAARPSRTAQQKPLAKVIHKPSAPFASAAAIATSAPPVEAPATKQDSADYSEENSVITEPVAADYLQNPPPEYPASARRHRQEGTVMLEVAVTREGRAHAVEISRSSGHSLLDDAAQNAVKRWQFIPARRGSEVIEASVIVPIVFQIN